MPGLRTTFGSPIYADHVPKEDALVVRRLREAGAVILGKTNCPEFAAGANTFNEVFGRTRNPWDPTKSAGGSTGGGAAALATGMIALAEGTDLGGSLRIPAAFCGITGLRPSVGLVPTHPTDWVWDTLQVTGPMARTAGRRGADAPGDRRTDERSPFAQPIDGRDFVRGARAARKNRSRGVLCRTSRASASIPVSSACAAKPHSRSRAQALIVEEIQLDLSAARPAFLSLRGLVVRHADVLAPRHAGSLRPERRQQRAVRPRSDVAESIAAAEAYRGQLWHQFRTFFNEYDHLLTPCVAVPPFPVEQNYPDTIAGKPMKTYIDWIAPTFVLSLTGLPVACVPAGLDSNGMPVGLQIAGGQFGEEDVLAIAAQISDGCGRSAARPRTVP